MIRIMADENIPPALVGALRQRISELDIETTHEAGLDGWSDPQLLERADENGQVLLTMDHRTVPDHAKKRASIDKAMCGVIVVHGGQTLKKIVDEMELILLCLSPDEIRNQVIHVPLS